MQVLRPICSYCGNVYKSEDDVNTGKSFCNRCSKARAAFAKQAFLGRRTVVVANGKYVVSKRKKEKKSNAII